MKSRKWIWWTLGILLALALMAGAGFAGYRMGAMQTARHATSSNDLQKAHPEGRGPENGFQFGNDFRGDQGPSQNFRGQNFGGRNFNFGRMHGGFMFLPHFIFGLIPLAVLILVIWLVVMLVKNSGWKLVKAGAPVAAVEMVEEKKVRGTKKTS